MDQQLINLQNRLNEMAQRVPDQDNIEFWFARTNSGDTLLNSTTVTPLKLRWMLLFRGRRRVGTAQAVEKGRKLL